MAKEIHYSKNMKECHYCGNDEFYIKQSYSGTCKYNYRFDGRTAENGEMYQSAMFRDIGKYAYCNKCYKRLFPIEEFYNN